MGLVVALVAMGIAVWALGRAGAAMQRMDDAYADIRARIGKLVRDINAVNNVEFAVDLQQEYNINALKRAAAASSAKVT